MAEFYISALWILILLLACTGILLILKSYCSTTKTRNRKLIYQGYIGTLFLLSASGIIVFFYSLKPVPNRVLYELHRVEQEDAVEDLPEISRSLMNSTVDLSRHEAS